MSEDENMPSVDLLRNCQPFKSLEKIGKLLSENKVRTERENIIRQDRLFDR